MSALSISIGYLIVNQQGVDHSAEDTTHFKALIRSNSKSYSYGLERYSQFSSYGYW